MTVEELQVLVTARTKGLQQQMQQVTKQLQGVQKQTDTMSNKMSKTFTNLKRTLVALGIGKVLKDTFNLARTYEASVQQVNRIFGLYSGALDKWVQKNAKTFGMARADAMKYASVYGNLVRAFEKDGSKMLDYTTGLMKATTIIASSTGRTVADVSERIRSGILGNTESIEDLGIYAQVAMLKTSNAFKMIADGRSWEQLTFQEQQQIRVMSILEQTSNQFGDSIQQNVNYKLMQLTANLKNVGLNIGQAFMPIVNVVLPVLNAMALALANATAKLAEFMNALFGTNFTAGAGVDQIGVGANSAADGFSDMQSSADGAADAAKKAGKAAKGALAGFDEINTLAKDTGGGSGGEAGTPTVDGGAISTPIENATSALEKGTQTFADRIKLEMDRLKKLFTQGFEIGIGGDFTSKIENIKSSFESLKENIKSIFNDPGIQSAFTRMVDSFVLNLGKQVGSITSIATTIAQNIVGGISKYIEQNTGFIREKITNIFDISSNISEIVGNFHVVLADIFSVFGGEEAQQVTANIIAIFANAWLGVQEITLRLGRDILDTVLGPIIENKELIKTSLEGLLSPIESITGTISGLITNTFSKISEVYAEYIEPAFKNIKDGLSSLLETMLNVFNENILPIVDNVAEQFSSLAEEYIQPAVDSMIEVFGALFEILSILFKKVLVPLTEYIIDILGPVIQIVFNTAASVVKAAIAIIMTNLKLVTDNLKLFIDFIKNVFSGDWEAAWGNIQQMFQNVFTTIGANIKILLGLFGEFISYIGTYVMQQWQNIWGRISAFFGNFITGISQKIGVVKNDFNGILTFIRGSFTSAWNSAWGGIKNTFNNMWDGMKNGARNSINYIIDKINGMIRGINNKLKFELPEILGGDYVGFDIPTIPRLARGGIVDGATFMGNYIAGEAGAEMIVPLENTSFVDKLANALGSAVFNAMRVSNNTNNNPSNDNTPVLEMDGIQFARLIFDPLMKEFRRRGVALDVDS